MTVTIIFGSETGTCENLASQAKSYFQKYNIEANVLDMNDVKAEDLKSFKNLLLITSTWGDGEPPTNAQGLYDELDETNIDLAELSYAVFAVGQSFYDNFCRTGKDFDEFLSKLGAKRLAEVFLSDDDSDETFLPWIEKIKGTISQT